MILLKQSTAVDILFGPFIDETDGKTAETGLTVTQAEVRLSKNGGNMAQKNEATSLAHDELGYYVLKLDATDTNTLGILKVMVHESGALPVWETCMVVTANIWDSLCSTDILQSDLTQIGGVAQSATDLKDFADAGYDPATNKVQGVVLVDTTTTNSDMVGTDNAATETKQDIIDTNIDQIETAVITNAAGTDIAADIIAIKAETAVIVNDTDVIDDGTSGLVKIAQDVAATLTDTGTTLEAHLTDIKGTGFVKDTNSLVDLQLSGGNVTADDISTAALAKFSTQDTGETTPVAGSVAKLAQGSAGGNVTLEDSSANKTILAKGMKSEDVSGTASVNGSIYDRMEEITGGTLTVSDNVVDEAAAAVEGALCFVFASDDFTSIPIGHGITDASGDITIQLVEGDVTDGSNSVWLWYFKEGYGFVNPGSLVEKTAS